MKTEEYENIKVIDGGFSGQLEFHLQQSIVNDPLWSSRYLYTEPKAVVATHLDFLRAGADIILTNTYQASIEGFMEYLKLSSEESFNLMKKAVQLAQTACDEFAKEYPYVNGRPIIAGSVGPYGAYLHDGSEYTGSYMKNTSMDKIKEWYRPKIKALIDGGVDILALETIPCRAEAEMLAQLIKEFPNSRAWISFSCQDEKSTAVGDNFQEAARSCYNLNPEQIIAVGVNCTSPEFIEYLFDGINSGNNVRPMPLLVYPNSGEKYDATLENPWVDRGKSASVDSFVSKWLDMGIPWIGGCCRVYAADISKIKHQIELWECAQIAKV